MQIALHSPAWLFWNVDCNISSFKLLKIMAAPPRPLGPFALFDTMMTFWNVTVLFLFSCKNIAPPWCAMLFVNLEFSTVTFPFPFLVISTFKAPPRAWCPVLPVKLLFLTKTCVSPPEDTSNDPPCSVHPADLHLLKVEFITFNVNVNNENEFKAIAPPPDVLDAQLLKAEP